MNVAAGGRRIVEIRTSFGRRWRRARLQLVVHPQDARRLLAGAERWSPHDRGPRWASFLLVLTVPLASEPAPAELRWWLEDRRSGERAEGRPLRVLIRPGYRRVGLLRALRRPGVVALRNRTSATWRHGADWLEAPDGRRLPMLEPVAPPGAVASFHVPRDLLKRPLELVSDRVARLRPPVVAA